MSYPQGNPHDPHHDNDPSVPRYDTPESGNYSFNSPEGTEYGSYSSGSQLGTPSYRAQSAPQYGAPAFQPLNSQNSQPYQSQFISQPEKKNGVWKWFLGCCLVIVVLVLLAGCLGVAGMVSTAVSSQLSSPSSTTDATSHKTSDSGSNKTTDAGASTTTDSGSNKASDAGSSTTTDAGSSASSSTAGKNPGVELKIDTAGPRAAELGKYPFTETAQGEFLPVKFEISNKTNEPISVFLTDLKLVGADGVQYDSNPGLFELDNGDPIFISDNVGPGLTIKGTLVFDIPKGAKIKELRYTNVFDQSSASAPIKE